MPRPSDRWEDEIYWEYHSWRGQRWRDKLQRLALQAAPSPSATLVAAADSDVQAAALELPSWLQQGGAVAAKLRPNTSVSVDCAFGSVGPLVDTNGVLAEHGDPVICWCVVGGRELERIPRSCILHDDDDRDPGELSPGVWNGNLYGVVPLRHVEFVVRTEKKSEYLAGALFDPDGTMFDPPQRCFRGFVEAGLAPPTWASRKGLRTLGCGDFVENERGAVAVVARTLTFEWPLESPFKQWRNVLVLYDEQAETFFIGGWSKWTRTTWPYGTWPYGDEVETLADFNDENVYVDGTAKIVKIDRLLALDKIRNLPTSTVVSRSKKDALTPTEEKDAAEERRRAQREKTRGRREAEARR